MTEDQMNRVRRSRALSLLTIYRDQMLKQPGKVSLEDVTDLLTDLRHLCESRGYDMDVAIGVSLVHYGIERESNGSD